MISLVKYGQIILLKCQLWNAIKFLLLDGTTKRTRKTCIIKVGQQNVLEKMA